MLFTSPTGLWAPLLLSDFQTFRPSDLQTFRPSVHTDFQLIRLRDQTGLNEKMKIDADFIVYPYHSKHRRGWVDAKL
jgi:hypothetical protein